MFFKNPRYIEEDYILDMCKEYNKKVREALAEEKLGNASKDTKRYLMIKRYQISLRLKDMDIQDRAIKTSNKDSIALEFRDIIENDISYEEYKILRKLVKEENKT
jgi:hypothetical protein